MFTFTRTHLITIVVSVLFTVLCFLFVPIYIDYRKHLQSTWALETAKNNAEIERIHNTAIIERQKAEAAAAFVETETYNYRDRPTEEPKRASKLRFID